MESIRLPETVNQKSKIYGTAKGMTAKEISRVRSALDNVFTLKKASLFDRHYLPIENPLIEDKNCYELLREYL